jgi:hypothetical protein
MKYMSECEWERGAGVADLEVVEEVVAAERREGAGREVRHDGRQAQADTSRRRGGLDTVGIRRRRGRQKSPAISSTGGRR